MSEFSFVLSVSVIKAISSPVLFKMALLLVIALASATRALVISGFKVMFSDATLSTSSEFTEPSALRLAATLLLTAPVVSLVKIVFKEGLFSAGILPATMPSTAEFITGLR